MDEGTYYETLECSNCHNLEGFYINKGETVDEFRSRIPCPRCGCTTMCRLPWNL